MTADPFRPTLGAYGPFGGRYASELLRPALEELERALPDVLSDPSFQEEWFDLLERWAGRPTPLTPAPNLSRRAGLEVFLKREDLLHGGAHKTNNVVGQALLARRLGKRRLIAETGAGQHGLAVAAVAARLGFEAVVFMGARDMERQRINVDAMRLFGAEVRAVTIGRATLKEAIDEALREWTESLATTHYVLGSVCGPHPFPSLVRAFQSVIGQEAREQFEEEAGGPPDAAVACLRWREVGVGPTPEGKAP